MPDVTRILQSIEDGRPTAAEELLPLVYEELRKLAVAKMAQETPDQTLQATALVHEAYLRLVDVDQAQQWNSRGHFFAAAAEAMRRILVENARRRQRKKHGGSLQCVNLNKVRIGIDTSPDDLLAINEALEKLTASDPRTAELVKLHCFAGLSIKQAAEFLSMPVRTAYRDWAFARAWLFRELEQDIRDPAD
jgi:RNA polymerase sigma factor (TIGR02999 family)